MPSERRAIPVATKREVLTEAGYRCAVPTCRMILAIDLHHIIEVSEGGENTLDNLIALCPTCHALHHRGEITADSIRIWKTMLVTLNNAFDRNTIDSLLFLRTLRPQQLRISGDGVLKYDRLIAAGLAEFNLVMQNGPIMLYEVGLTAKGKMVVDAWKSGNRAELTTSLGT